MALNEVDWSKYLYEETEMQTDVVFTFAGEDEGVRAHKLLLAVVSPVFQTQFFGNLPAGETVVIEGCSRHAFSRFIALIYDANLQVSEDNNLDLMFEVMNLAQKYRVDSIITKTHKAIDDCNIDLADVASCAETAMKYRHFEEESEIVMKKCAVSIDRNATNMKSQLANILQIANSINDKELFVKLLTKAYSML